MAERDAPPTRPSTSRTARLEGVLDRIAVRNRSPHVAVAVAATDGSWSWSGARGDAGPTLGTMQTNTPYFVASVTKLYTTTLVLRLAERGELRLDEPVLTYLPQAAGIHHIGTTDHTPTVTLRHLLAHASGLPDHLEDAPRGERSWYRQLARGQDRSWDLDDVIARTREIGGRFPPRDPTDPRQRGRYSDAGFQLLIGTVEQVTGRTFAKVLDGEVFEPLGLTHTHPFGSPEAPAPAAVFRRSQPVDVPSALTASNDLVSTLEDQLAFLGAMVTGRLFDQPDTYASTHAVMRRILMPLRYGLGTMGFTVNRLAAPGRRPATLIGHSGATGTWLFRCPEHELLLAGTVDELGSRSAPFRIMARLLKAAAEQ